MRFALDAGWRRDDPTLRINAFRSPSEGVRTWSEVDITAFENRFPSGSRPRLALALLVHTGQRKGDVVHMGRQHLKGGRIDIRQHKTGTRLQLPIHPALRTELDAVPPDQLTFLTTAEGLPFTPAGFGNWFADRVREAGLSGLSAHGLRKACARRLAEAGCTAHEIAAITGHRSLREVERYTRAADQGGLADRAMERLHRKQMTNET